MINTPAPRGPWGGSTVRHSTGGVDSAAGRLSSDFTRMSFEGSEQNASTGADAARGVVVVNPYASAFFSGSAMGEQAQLPFPGERVVAGSADCVDYDRSGW
jgi:hypothetical protein